MTRLEAFQPHAGLLLQVMISFPETLSVIHVCMREVGRDGRRVGREERMRIQERGVGHQ